MKINKDLIADLKGTTTIDSGSTLASLDTITNNHTLKLLWKNPNPNNSFGAQTITLSSSDYDYLIFLCRFQSGMQIISQITLKGCGTLFGVGWDYNGGSGNTYYSAGFRRTFSRNSDTSFSVSDCYIRQGSSTTNYTNSNNIVPLYVYGGKFK